MLGCQRRIVLVEKSKVIAFLGSVQALLVFLVVASLVSFAVSVVAYSLVPKPYRYASPEASVHCALCPSDDCVCVLGKDRTWYISPEVGE